MLRRIGLVGRTYLSIKVEDSSRIRYVQRKRFTNLTVIFAYLWNLLNASAPTFCRCSSTVAEIQIGHLVQHKMLERILTNIPVIFEASLLLLIDTCQDRMT